MKRIISILSLAALLCTGCYPEYVKDYAESGIFVAYQYDLRTFVAGEGMKFDFTVGLGGVIENTLDRHVSVKVDRALINTDLSIFSPEGQSVAPFNAYSGMMGKAPIGYLSNPYVTSDISLAGVTTLSPLPSDYYTVEGLDDMVISKGAHTAAVTIRADEEKILADPAAFKPQYAIGFRIESADADYIPSDRSFSVIAVRCENTYYGNWYHYGKTTFINSSGEPLSEETYARTVPETNTSRIYVLSTRDGSSVSTNRMGNASGKLLLTFGEGDSVTVSSADGSVSVEPYGEGSRTNGASRLQDRKIFLNYKVSNADGSAYAYTDTLEFRNRIRDGINEWRSEK